MTPTSVRYRHASADDAQRVAALHAASWRRHYRGAYADSFLDADVLADRRAVWSARLAEPAGSITVLAEDGGGLAGFVHVILDDDAEWGSLIDNLHVAHRSRRTGAEQRRTAVLSRVRRRLRGAGARPAPRRCGVPAERFALRAADRLAGRVRTGPAALSDP
jgi:hypothetical protein